MAFSATDAAFEGFRLTREKPVAVLIWAALYLVITLISSLLLVLWAGQDMAAMREVSATATAPADPERAAEMMQGLAKIYAIGLPIGLISSGLLTCAVFRAVLRPQDKGLGYLKFGAEELRMILLFVLIFFIFMAVLIGATLLVGLVTAGVAFAVASAGGGAAALSTLVGMLGVVAVLAAMVWLAVRLSLAGPMTFVEGRIDLRGAWMMTRGNFWPIFGAGLLAWVLAILVTILGAAILFGVGMVVGGGLSAVDEIMNPDTSSLAAYFTPTFFVVSVFSAIFSALQYAIVIATPAMIYRDLKGMGEAEAFG